MNRLLQLQKHLISSKIKDFTSFAQGLSSSTIKKHQMGLIVYGRNYPARLSALQLIKSHPQLYIHYHLQQSTRSSQREKSVQIMFKSHRLINMPYQEYVKDPNKLSLICSAYVNYDYGYSVKSGVHFFLYLRALINLGTQKHQQFIKKATNYEDIGCFALTELQHGSNVKGIQTQATYDHHTQQFILHTPDKGGMKFWIGAAGQVANMAVVWANLYVGIKNHGLHAFVVPLRDSTHKLKAGVLVGDCGPKTGLNVIDNGFIIFDHYRIPRVNLLDKVSGVDENGNFFNTVKTQQKRFGLHLSALSGGRFMISMNCSILALNALTIGLRYTFIRKQFSKSSSKPQQDLLISYPLTKRRLLPLLATTIVYMCGTFSILQQWDSKLDSIMQPSNPAINQLHFISSSLKPKNSILSSQCIRQSRQMMGGHGYSSFSKMGVLQNDNQVNTTWQGDNNVLLQQTVKIILEQYRNVMTGKHVTIGILKFLENPPVIQSVELTQENIKDLNFGRRFLQYKISQKVQQMGMKMMSLKEAQTNVFDIWNQSQVYFGKVISLSLGDLFYLQTILTKLSLCTQPNKTILTECTILWLCRLYLQDQLISSSQHGLIQFIMMQICQKLTGEILGLLDCLSAGEQVIGSPFSNQIGNGFTKYMDYLENINKQYTGRPEWWKEFVSRFQHKV